MFHWQVNNVCLMNVLIVKEINGFFGERFMLAIVCVAGIFVLVSSMFTVKNTAGIYMSMLKYLFCFRFTART